MNYCSNCGRPLDARARAMSPIEHYRCDACDYTHYVNPKTIVACIAYWQDAILMCLRAEAPATGQWVFPSGFLECGETLQEGAARETFEETGLKVDPDKLELYSVVNMTDIQQVIIAFRAALPSIPPLQPGPECIEVAFKTEAEAALLEIAWIGSIGNALPLLFQEVRSDSFGIHVMTKASGQNSQFTSRAYPIVSSKQA
jgi:ADP-ribose pyrophosphatase YjhB (NUDIX family)